MLINNSEYFEITQIPSALLSWLYKCTVSIFKSNVQNLQIANSIEWKEVANA